MLKPLFLGCWHVLLICWVASKKLIEWDTKLGKNRLLCRPVRFTALLLEPVQHGNLVKNVHSLQSCLWKMACFTWLKKQVFLGHLALAHILPH